MLKIAVISASGPDNKNTGMLTVDLAAAALQSELPGVELNWFTFPTFTPGGTNEFVNLTKPTIQFHDLPDCLEQIYDHDLIVYWGDFLNSRTFMYQSGPIQVKRLGYSPEQTWDVMARCLLLRDAPNSVLNRTILFGGTVLPDKQSDLEDEAYRTPFTRLVSQCHRIWMREPISAARVAILRNHQESCLGSDAALLLPTSVDFPVNPISEGHERRIGLFVGSRSVVTKDLLPFVDDLSRRFDAEIDWLPWLRHSPAAALSFTQQFKSAVKLSLPLLGKRVQELDAHRSRQSRELVDSLRERTLRPGDWSIGDLLRQLSRYKFIITDTYHVCINAWRLGVPAICLGSEQHNHPSQQSTLTDLKKHILYLTYQATDFYVTPSQLKNREAAQRAAELLDSPQPAAIAERIELHARKVKTELVTTIRKMLRLSSPAA